MNKRNVLIMAGLGAIGTGSGYVTPGATVKRAEANCYDWSMGPDCGYCNGQGVCSQCYAHSQGNCAGWGNPCFWGGGSCL
jgi:hypothetical protein